MTKRQITKNIIDGSYDSVLGEVQMLLHELNELSKKAKRDYNEVKRFTSTGDEQSIMSLEDVRKNSLNSLKDYFELRYKVIKLYSEVSKNIQDSKLKEKADDEIDKTELDFKELKNIAEQVKKMG